MNKSKCKVCGSAHTIKYGIRNGMQLDPNIQILLPEPTTQFDPLRLCMLKIPRNLTHTPYFQVIIQVLLLSDMVHIQGLGHGICDIVPFLRRCRILAGSLNGMMQPVRN